CLAVFAGGWTIEAAAAVSELPLREALARLEALAERSPVVRQRSNDVANPRFTTLETMRESGFAWLAEAGNRYARTGAARPPLPGACRARSASRCSRPDAHGPGPPAGR